MSQKIYQSQMKFYEFSCFKPSTSAFDIEKGFASCLWHPIFGDKPQPCQRSHHSICVYKDQIFLLGGRSGSGTMNEFWVYNTSFSTWSKLSPSGCVPPPLEGHSMVTHEDTLYVFGGETSFASADESPLWKYDIKGSNWIKVATYDKVMVPGGRRHHTAVLCMGAMCLYGGYRDLMGPTKDLWLYDFETQSWHFDVAASSVSAPDARYGHCSVMKGRSMWVCGGLTGLKPNSDVYIWNFELTHWLQVKTKSGPAELSGHAMCLVDDSLFVVGGRTSAKVTSNDVWHLSLQENIWRKCQCNAGVKPPPISGHRVVILSQPTCHKHIASTRCSSVPDMKGSKKIWPMKKSHGSSASQPTSYSCGMLPNDSMPMPTVPGPVEKCKLLPADGLCDSISALSVSGHVDKCKLLPTNNLSDYVYDNPVITECSIDNANSPKHVRISEHDMATGASTQTIRVNDPDLTQYRCSVPWTQTVVREDQRSSRRISCFSYNLLRDSVERGLSPALAETSFMQVPCQPNSVNQSLRKGFEDVIDVKARSFKPEPCILHDGIVGAMAVDFSTDCKPPRVCVEAWSDGQVTEPETKDEEVIRMRDNDISETLSVVNREDHWTLLLVGGRAAISKPFCENAFCMWQCTLFPCTS